jgi:Putative zinc-finger
MSPAKQPFVPEPILITIRAAIKTDIYRPTRPAVSSPNARAFNPEKVTTVLARCGMTHACTTSVEELLAYWLDEVDEADEQRIDEHLFACTACATRLHQLANLGSAIRQATLAGDFGYIVPAAFTTRMKQAGLTVREYSLAPGGSVNCTIAPTDDLVCAHVSADLQGVSRLDVVIEDEASGAQRLSDVPFDAGEGGVTVVPSAVMLRGLGVARQRMRLVAVEGMGERVVGEYTFNHSPTARD